METIDDIVRYIRDMESRTVGGIFPVNPRKLANRIEAAVKNQFRDTTEMVGVVVAENATITPTRDKSSQVGNAAAMYEALKYLRDASREFCHLIRNSKYNGIMDEYKYAEVVKIQVAIANANAVLSLPRSNCEVYTMEEQSKRHEEYCKSHSTNGRCVKCPLWQMRLLGINCAIAWANFPYEKEGEK